MENNEQNKVVEPVSETTNTIMVSEPNSVETPAEKAPAVETPVVEPTQTTEPQPVVIPKGEKPKINKKKPNPILIILALILLGGACYFEYIYFVKPIINDASATANNTTEGNTKTNTEEKNESSDEIDGEVLVEDETIGKVVAANKKIVSTKDTDGSKDYTYDLYLGNKLLVANLEYHEDDGYNSDGRIMAKKIGILKDSETAAKYLAFTVYSSPTKYANITFFVVDKDGKVMYKRTSNSNGTYQLSEAPNGYAYDTLYIIDGDTVLFYEENHDDNSLIAKNIKVNSGVVNVIVYKTYTSEQLKNESKNQNSNNAADTNVNNDTQNETAGLFSKNGTLLVSWDDLVNKYGLDIEKDYDSPMDYSNMESSTANTVFTKNNFSGKLVLPNTVTKIGRNAFAGCEGLIEIVIPGSVTTIGGGAFDANKNLMNVTLPEGLKTIGMGAFSGCKSLGNIVIPSGVTLIPASAFSTSGLTEIAIPSTVEKIDYSAFSFTPLKKVTLSNGLTKIGDSAFMNCNNLRSITIPSSVTTIGIGAFYATNISEMVFEEPTGWNVSGQNMDLSNPTTNASYITTYRGTWEKTN